MLTVRGKRRRARRRGMGRRGEKKLINKETLLRATTVACPSVEGMERLSTACSRPCK
jgi:hypothetical protein